MIIKSSLKEKIGDRKKHSTVVVADRDRDNLIFVGSILDTLELPYYLADNGKNALDLVYEKKPTLVLLDVVMPYLDGIEANILIKSDLFTNHIHTIAITESTDPEHIKSIKNVGFSDYAIKPFVMKDLETRIRRFIRN